MTDWIPEEILTALIESGKTALRFYDAPEAWLKSDRSVVTAADHAIEHDLELRFEDPENDSFIIGEETIDTKSQEYIEEAFRRVAWIVDPIDGTAPYSHHIPIWGVSIARMENGVITDGGVHLPVTGEVFITSGPEVLYAAKTGSVSLSDLKPIDIIRKPPDISGMMAVTQSVVKHGSFSLRNPVQALACAVFPLCYLLLGRYIAYMGTVKLWDIAGCLAMLARAGFPCVTQSGKEIGKEVTNDIFHLDPDGPRRWFLRERIFCGSTRETVEYLLKGISQKTGSS
jgi:myo-inositol-1(or 4)-monophosphatase